MIALLIAGGIAFATTVLGTPALIKVLRARGIGQLIRDDGPFTHPHAGKAGTPTMGGIAIVGGVVLGYAVAHVRTEQLKFARTGLTLMFLVVGLAVVGFVDDYLGVRKGRNLGLRKRGKTGGELLVGSGFALLALEWAHASTDLSFTRSLDLNLGSGIWFLLAVVVVYGTSNAIEPHRRDGRPRRRFGNARVRRVHGDLLLAVPAPGGVRARSRLRHRARDHRGRVRRRVRRVPVVERSPGADLHGRYRLARDRRCDGRASHSSRTPCCSSRSSAGST